MSRGSDSGWLSLRWFGRDGKFLLLTKFLRTLAFGYLSVSLPFYFGRNLLGFSDFLVGAISTVALVGGVIFTLLAGIIANKVSRKASLSLFAVFIVASGVLLTLSTDLSIILIAVFVGSIGVNATETGPFASIEQAIIPQTTQAENRTYAFSVYNLLGYAGASFGSLLGAVPTILEGYLGFTSIDGYRVLFASYALIGLLMLLLYRYLSQRAELQGNQVKARGVLRPSKSKRTIAELSVLFSIDAFGGGFVIQYIIAFWFQQRFNASLSAASGIFFVTQLVTAASFLLAGRLAKRIGLLKTMVFTHLPSNLLLMGVGLAPSFETSVAFLFARQTLSQMDVPTRQSYMMAIIEPGDRNLATSITNVSRTVASTVPPSFSGYLIDAALLAAPFLFAGSLKIAYDILIYFRFRNVKPPEERSGGQG